MLQRMKFWIKIRDSFWFVPTVYSIVALLLVFFLDYTDEWIVNNRSMRLVEVLNISEEVSRGLYTSLVTAILTMTTISFSVIMVVLTTYSSQFSPRTLQDFMQSKTTHHVLGVFCLGFIFALLNLVLMGTHDSIIGPIVMVIITIVCLAFFIYFIHHAARWLQVSSLIEFIHVDSMRVIKNNSANKDYGEYESWDEEIIKSLKKQSRYSLLATSTGYVQKIEWVELVKWAKEQDCVIDFHCQIGDYLTTDLPILSVYTHKHFDDLKDVRELIIFGNERTDLEDIEFNIQKMVEIAVKAVSPSINDPNTAIDCIHRIGSVLSDLGKGFKEIHFLTDNSDELRLIKQARSYENYLYKSFYQIIYYGKEDISVCYSMLEVLYKMCLSSDEPIKRKIWTFHFYILEAIDWDALHSLDRQHLESIYRKLKDTCGKNDLK